MNAFSLKGGHCTLQSLTLDALDLKLHLMHSRKPFYTQNTQTISPSTQNILNGFKQALHYSSLTNKPQTTQENQVICFQSVNTFKPLK